jgi:mono/diheme cytochrome c family protein
VTEIPEHLLKRSRERRDALGLSSGEAGAAPEAVATPGAQAPVAATAATPAPIAPVEPAVPAAPEPVPPYVEAAQRRRRMPYWAAPVLVGLPLWAIMYVGTLETPAAEAAGLLAEGSEMYTSCAACHGGGGGGGVGPQLSGGEVLLTFPEVDEMVAWVVQGSPAVGTPYGSPDRPGGQRIAGGGMPAYGDSWTNEQIVAVVLHERAALSGSEADAELAAQLDEALAGGAELGEDWSNDTSLEEIRAVLEQLGVMGEG